MATLLEMRRRTTTEQMAVMSAWLAGDPVEMTPRYKNQWTYIAYPSWNFDHYEYRIKDEDDNGSR